MTRIDTDLVATVLADLGGVASHFQIASRIAVAVWGPSSERTTATQARVDRFYDLADGVAS